MTEAQAGIAMTLLNSYAHDYLGLSHADVMVAAGRKHEDLWILIVARKEGTLAAANFDAAKRIIDKVNMREAL